MLTGWTAARYTFASRRAHRKSHGVTVITALYLPLALEWKPARWDFLWALLLANVYLAAVDEQEVYKRQEMGAELGSYVEYPASKKDLLAVLRLHNAAQKLATALPAQKLSLIHISRGA